MKKNSIDRDELAGFLAKELQVTTFRDYCPNGLQVEGRKSISNIVTGVTACLALIEAAIDCNADAMIVHHGYFWRGEDARVIGQKQKRLKQLLSHDISLFAYHLPLDAHPSLGNNAQLAQRLGFELLEKFGDENLACLGQVSDTSIQTLAQLSTHVETCLGRTPMVIGDVMHSVEKIAWCTGAAHSMLQQAIDAGATVFISGEISEPTVHLAREAGIAYMACGHHATERYGVQALGDMISRSFGVEHQFIDIDNPV
jgi:dinuclear metal center YbgI/SA1388 family protein